MLSSAKFSTLWFVLCFAVVTSAAFAVKIDLPEDTIIVEAEAGKMDKGVTLVNQKDASEGKAIDSAIEAITTHEIDIPKTGDWYVWVRLYCPDGGADSYWIGIKDAKPNPNDPAGGPEAVKIYSEAGDSVNTNAQDFISARKSRYPVGSIRWILSPFSMSLIKSNSVSLATVRG